MRKSVGWFVFQAETERFDSRCYTGKNLLGKYTATRSQLWGRIFLRSPSLHREVLGMVEVCWTPGCSPCIPHQFQSNSLGEQAQCYGQWVWAAPQLISVSACRHASLLSASSVSASRRTATTLMPRLCTVGSALAANGTWPSTSGARPRGVAALVPVPSMSPHTSCPASGSPLHPSWLSLSPALRRSHHPHHHRRPRRWPRHGTAPVLAATG